MYAKNILSNQVRNVTIRISKNCFMGCCFQCHVSSIWKTCTRKKSGLNAFQAKGEEALFIQDKNEKRSDSFAGFLFLFFLFWVFCTKTISLIEYLCCTQKCTFGVGIR